MSARRQKSRQAMYGSTTTAAVRKNVRSGAWSARGESSYAATSSAANAPCRRAAGSPSRRGRQQSFEEQAVSQSSIAFVGFDVHQESIDIAIDDGGRRGLRGRIGGDATSVDKAEGSLARCTTSRCAWWRRRR